MLCYASVFDADNNIVKKGCKVNGRKQPLKTEKNT
jgi:hypothetical protein